MLKILNNLRPFFEDCYRRIGVREYAGHIKVSPPTASKILSRYSKEGLLRMERYRNFIFYNANNKSRDFIDLSRIYWRRALKEMLYLISNEVINAVVVLFGSLAKAEAKIDSDIDIAIFAQKKELDATAKPKLEAIQNKMKRNIQLFWFESIKDAKSKELANNVINGYVLEGRLVI